MRQWWNWYTRWSKKPMPKGLRVQVSPDAPRILWFNLGVMSAWLDGLPWKQEDGGSNPSPQTKS